MNDRDRFDLAIARIDEANAQDPRTESVAGGTQPRELLFARRVYDWLPQLIEHPTEELLLAARAHTIRRWRIPRDRFPMNLAGYRRWRTDLASFHADEAAAILRDTGYDREFIERVRRLITREDFPNTAEARALEDADCLVFLETKLHRYVDEWDPAKAIRILRKTIKKMTPLAVEQAGGLNLPSEAAELLQQAMRRP